MEFFNTDVLLVALAAPTLLLMVYVDRYLGRRRRITSNAEYLARIEAARGNSPLHQFGRSHRVDQRCDGTVFVDLRGDAQIELSAVGFFSRRRIINDQFGRVVATHYEEFSMADHCRKIPARPLLMLASAKA